MLQAYREHAGRRTGLRHSWEALRQTPLRKVLVFCVLFVRYLPMLMPLVLARRGTSLHALVRARPEILRLVLTSFLAANWDPRTRIARIIDHCRTVTDIGGVVDFPPDFYVELLRLNAIDPRYSITLDQARWLLREGPLVLSLWDRIDRIFHLGFCLSCANGRRTAYIGSVQGRARETGTYHTEMDVLERYRHFTKAAAGMRPRDFIIEVFKMFCRAVGVVEIRAVSELNHPQRKMADVKLPYDTIWLERGGTDGGEGFFILPVTARQRSDGEIKAKKRAMYARRYAMLAAIESDLAAVLTTKRDFAAPGT